MKRTPITDHDVEALLTGQVPPGRPELDELASLLAGLRHEPLPPPTPSSELTAWMQGHRPSPTTTSTRRPARRRLAAWIAGLSIGAQVALGTTVAAAALAGAGIADILPEEMQRPFDDVRDHLGLLDQTDSPTPAPTPTPSEDLPPAQVSTDVKTDRETKDRIRPVSTDTSPPDPAPGPRRDDPTDKANPEGTTTAPSTQTTPDAGAQAPATANEPTATDRDGDTGPTANETQHGTGSTTTTLAEDTPHPDGTSAETTAPTTVVPTPESTQSGAPTPESTQSGAPTPESTPSGAYPVDGTQAGHQPPVPANSPL